VKNAKAHKSGGPARKAIKRTWKITSKVDSEPDTHASPFDLHAPSLPTDESPVTAATRDPELDKLIDDYYRKKHIDVRAKEAIDARVALYRLYCTKELMGSVRKEMQWMLDATPNGPEEVVDRSITGFVAFVQYADGDTAMLSHGIVNPDEAAGALALRTLEASAHKWGSNIFNQPPGYSRVR